MYTLFYQHWRKFRNQVYICVVSNNWSELNVLPDSERSQWGGFRDYPAWDWFCLYYLPVSQLGFENNVKMTSFWEILKKINKIRVRICSLCIRCHVLFSSPLEINLELFLKKTFELSFYWNDQAWYRCWLKPDTKKRSGGGGVRFI